jgi:hypothetical protein
MPHIARDIRVRKNRNVAESVRPRGHAWRTACRRGRTFAVVALLLGSVLTPGLVPAAQASTTKGGTWRYYGTSGVPLTSAWHCGSTANKGAPQYVSIQACVIKQSGSEQVALIVNARAANNVSLSAQIGESSFQTVYWTCPGKAMSWGYSVCYGGSSSYSGSVTTTAAGVQWTGTASGLNAPSVTA